MRKQFLVFLAVILTMTLALNGCKGEKENRKEETNQLETNNNSLNEPTYGGSIVVGIPQDLEDSLDPHIAKAAGTNEILFNIFEGLVKINPDGELIPAVASDIKVSKNKKRYTFTLRENVHFHNGELVTVNDIKYSIDRCADTSKGAPLVSAYSIIKDVNILDDRTVEIVLKEPNAEFLSYMTTEILPADYNNQDVHPIGTGPFQFESRSPQENIVLKRFEDYWGQKSYLDKITLKIVGNADTIVMDLKGGSLDLVARLTATQAAELTNDFNIEESTMNLVQAIYLNHQAKPFDNLKVRQAMCYAINPQEVMNMIADGKGVEIGSSMFPEFKKYYIEELKDVYNPNIEKAKELLIEAGYPDGFDMKITVPSNYQPHIDTAQVIVEQLKQAGIQASIELIEWDSWLSQVYTERNYQSTIVGVDASSLTARALLERFTSKNSGNFTNYNNPDYDKIFEKAISATDEEKQIVFYKDLEKILTEDAANVYIQDLAELVAVNKKLGGYTFYPIYVQDFSTLYYLEQQ